jgi:serine/threonine-protein kinase ULK2
VGTASFEVDYVLVESRRAVEVNALADELAYSPRRASEKQPRYDALIKRGTSYATGNTGTSPVAITTQARNPRGALTEQRSVSAPVYPHGPGSPSHSPTGQGYIPSERRFGTSPSSALAKAISMASMKLFGSSTPSPPYPQSYPVERGTMVKAGGIEEEIAVREIEDIALRSNVVFQFAEMKLLQIMRSSSSSGGGVIPSSPSALDRRRDSWKNSILTDGADAALCSEALALYVKSLTLLQKSMDLAARYWQRRGGTGVASAPLNNAVQWGRARFNETLEKADFVKSKIPVNLPESSVAPEKLIYDRALEMVYRFILQV